MVFTKQSSNHHEALAVMDVCVALEWSHSEVLGTVNVFRTEYLCYSHRTSPDFCQLLARGVKCYKVDCISEGCPLLFG